MPNRGLTLSALACACLLSGGIAAPAAAADLNELAAASRFIVHSRVSKIDYTMSQAAKGRPAVPHTVVTFDVVKSLGGSPGASSITLRFIGGPDGRGRFMQASNVPVFQLGDEDVLFVSGNGTQGCALAGCLDGRFRVLNGMMYDGTGAPVLRVESGQVDAGGPTPAEFTTIRFPRPSFDALMTNAEARDIVARQGMTMAEARQRYEAESPAMVEMQSRTSGSSGSDRVHDSQQVGAAASTVARTMTADSFVAKLSGLALARAEGAQAFESVDAQARIAAPSSQATAPAKAPVSRAPARSAADIAEEKALPKDDLSLTQQKPQ
jgi:hypothetical protein